MTTDLSKFGYRERKMAEELLHAWNEDGLPEDFYDEDVTMAFNENSGYVFLTNSDYQVAMMNGDNLEMWHYCGECGNEGFKEDFEPDASCKECRSIAKK